MNSYDRKEFKRLQKAQLKAQTKGNLKEEAEICNTLGELLAKNGDYEEAIKEHRRELLLSESLSDVVGAGVANRKIGECYSELNIFGKALKYQKKHLELAQSIDNHLEEQRALATIGRTYLCQADTITDPAVGDMALQKAKHAFVKSLAVCDKLKHSVTTKELQEMRARLFLNLGLVFDNQRDHGNCVKFIEQAVFIAEKHKLFEDLYRAHFSLGGIYLKSGNNSKALRRLEASVRCAREMKEKHMESEAVALSASVYFKLGDFVAAKRALRKACKLGSRLPDERKNIVINLKAAISGCKLLHELESTPDADCETKMQICESLGDLCCKVMAFERGIGYYQRQLKWAVTLRKDYDTLIPIYISLAATYQDIRLYDKAIECYKKELELRPDNPKEDVKTWLNIAQSQEDNQADYSTVYKSYKEALDCAVRSNIPMLQMRTLKSLAVVQDKYKEHENRADTLERLSKLKETYDIDSDDDAEMDDTETQDSETVELEDSDLCNTDDSDDEENYRRQRNKMTKRNEKGETPLHRASIDGNFRVVQQLVEKGHPVNCRDYCGWLPIHEASNNGYYNIVEYLLDHGAAINDRGGDGCQGVTPLHDSINCGNFDIAELLVSKGANVLAKDDEGTTPLDTLLKWQETYKEDLDNETLNNVEKLEKMLIATSKKVKSTLRPSKSMVNQCADRNLFDNEIEESDTEPSVMSTKPRWQKHQPDKYQARPLLNVRNNDISKRRALLDIEDEEDDSDLNNLTRDHFPLDSARQRDSRHKFSPSTSGTALTRNNFIKAPEISDSMDIDETEANTENSAIEIEDTDEFYRNPLLDNAMELSQPETASLAYRDAIVNVGSRSSRAQLQKRNQTSPPVTDKGEPAAMIPEEEYIGDNWLVHDMRQKVSKRKRTDAEPVSRQDTFAQNRNQNTSRPSLSRNSKMKKAKQLKLTSMTSSTLIRHDINSALRSHVADESADDDAVEEVTDRDTSVQSTLSAVKPPATSQSVIGSSNAPMRVRVRVQNKTFLIPIQTRDKTISWLTEQSTQRYYALSGQRPNLVLMTSEGALFSPEDTVVDVISIDEEVIGDVQSWDLKPLPERYSKICESAHTTEQPKIREILATSHSSKQLAFQDLALTDEEVIPLFKALQRQYSIKQLVLSGNQIKDAAIHHLTQAVMTLPSLSILDLSCNTITEQGLKTLSSALDNQITGSGDGEADLQRREGNKPLQALEVLDLSFNPLSDDCTLYLATIIKHCPLLSTLRLTSCQLTASFFRLHQRNLREALQSALHFHTLAVSYNDFGPTGVKLLFECLPASMLLLDLSYTVSTNSMNLGQHVKAYLMRADTALHSLNLSGCCLTNRDLQEISGCFSNKKCLSSLCVSSNSKLGNSGLQCLVDSLHEHKAHLGELIFTGCPFTSPLDSQLVESFRKISVSEFPLEVFKFSTLMLNEGDINSLYETWKNHRPNATKVSTNGHECIFYEKSED